jgi:O-6-methylguanine DNA methyltransferase
MIIADRDETALRAALAPLAPPAGLAAQVLRVVRKRTATGLTLPRFDVTASTAGVTRVGLGHGEADGPTARARGWARAAQEQLVEYLAGERSYFTVPLDLATVGPFQRAVLDVAQAIPFGEIRPYRWVAEQIGKGRAVRAVGTALGGNPIPLIVPCHRVLRSDGTLGGYAFGLPLKSRLLDLERETPALLGCTTTRIVCRRGCPHGRRAAADREVVFASVVDARSVGYRPCRHCRPAA